MEGLANLIFGEVSGWFFGSGIDILIFGRSRIALGFFKS